MGEQTKRPFGFAKHPKGRITTSNPAFLGCSTSGVVYAENPRSWAHDALAHPRERRDAADRRGELEVLYHFRIREALVGNARVATITIAGTAAQARVHFAAIAVGSSSGRHLWATLDLAHRYSALQFRAEFLFKFPNQIPAA
jgi:hypothetical protein